MEIFVPVVVVVAVRVSYIVFEDPLWGVEEVAEVEGLRDGTWNITLADVLGGEIEVEDEILSTKLLKMAELM